MMMKLLQTDAISMPAGHAESMWSHCADSAPLTYETNSELAENFALILLGESASQQGPLLQDRLSPGLAEPMASQFFQAGEVCLADDQSTRLRRRKTRSE